MKITGLRSFAAPVGGRLRAIASANTNEGVPGWSVEIDEECWKVDRDIH